MKNKEDVFIKKLENLDVPEIKVSKHSQILRSRLLSSASFERSHSMYFFNFKNYFLHIKNLINNSMNQKKKFAFGVGGVFVVFALVVITSFSTLNINSSNVAHAEASKLIEKSVTVAANITPEMRTRIEAMIDVDMVAILKEAYVAPDLKILTKDEIPNFNLKPAESGKITKVNSAVETTKEEKGVSIAMVAPAVKFISYTNPKGKKTILGLAQDDTLVFASIDSVSTENSIDKK